MGAGHGARRRRSGRRSQAGGKRGRGGQAEGAKPAKPIELYYWPTPNGCKISIMLEECGLPYTMIPVNIRKGDQFKPEFLAISPNNRMPAIVDPDGPGGRPISIFESGAILQYLGRKTGKFYPGDERARVEVEQWLFWQMGGLGPMAGQAHHFRNYAPEKIALRDRPLHQRGEPALRRDEQAPGGSRLPRRQIFDRRHGLRRLGQAAGSGRARTSTSSRISSAGSRRVKARPAVQRGMALGIELRQGIDMKDPNVQAVLFGQRARAG